MRDKGGQWRNSGFKAHFKKNQQQTAKCDISYDWKDKITILLGNSRNLKILCHSNWFSKENISVKLTRVFLEGQSYTRMKGLKNTFQTTVKCNLSFEDFFYYSWTIHIAPMRKEC